jgi:hypothetical protein
VAVLSVDLLVEAAAAANVWAYKLPVQKSAVFSEAADWSANALTSAI